VTAEDLVDEYVLGRWRAERLPELATQLLLAGQDTDEMTAAAMPDTKDAREIRELFEAALESTGWELPPWNVAATRWLTRRARAAVDGEATHEQVAREICDSFGWPADADPLPAPFGRVVITAGHASEHWGPDAFHDALTDLVRFTS
jgi:hypothetical protein